jgi:hypothetical protein
MPTNLQEKTLLPFLSRREAKVLDSSERYFYFEIGICKKNKRYPRTRFGARS